MTVKLGENGIDRPDKYSGVPVEITAAQERFRQVWIRLFSKTDDLKCIGVLDLFAALDVPKAGAGPGRRDADGNQVSASLGSQCGTLQIGLKCCLIRDSMVRRQHHHG